MEDLADVVIANQNTWVEMTESYLARLLEKESSRTVLRLVSPQLKYRGYLVVSLIDASARLNLGNCVLHTAVYLLDHFLESYSVAEDRLLEVSYTCLYVAAKFELEGPSLPSYALICQVGNIPMLDRETLMTVEMQIFSNVNYDLLMPNITHFVDFYKTFLITEDDLSAMERPTTINFVELKQALVHKIDGYLNITLQDVNLSLYPPSLLAMACVLSTRLSHGLNIWPSDYNKLSQHHSTEVYALSRRLSKMMDITISNPELKRRYHFEDRNYIKGGYKVHLRMDEGYCTGKSSPETSSSPECTSPEPRRKRMRFN